MFDTALVDYSESYEDTQTFSERFNEYIEQFSTQLIEKYGLRGKTVLEIGCGRGDFLRKICALGSMRGIGFDPSYRCSDNDLSKAEGIRFYQDFYSGNNCAKRADLVVCRHTLEHIPAVGQFVRMLRVCLDDQPNCVVCFEVPDTERILQEEAFWDVYYEHCAYFTPFSLGHLFRESGFEILAIDKTYNNQYIVIEARPVSENRDWTDDAGDIARLLQCATSFQHNVGTKLRSWEQQLNYYRQKGERVAIWGAGSKAAGFLTALNVPDTIGCIVDINPNKQGFYQAGTRQRIVQPEYLRGYRPDHVIVMNSIYMDEISKKLDSMGLSPQIVAL